MPKVKKMSKYTSKKLELTSSEDKLKVEELKKKLQSINQEEVKERIENGGINNVVMEEYLHN